MTYRWHCAPCKKSFRRPSGLALHLRWKHRKVYRKFKKLYDAHLRALRDILPSIWLGEAS